MAHREEYTVTDARTGETFTYVVGGKSAQENTFVRENDNADRLFREDAERAAAAGVTGVDKIDYAEALENYESRPDVEPLANRRAREAAYAFADQDFARAAVQEATALQNSTIGTTSVAVGDDTADYAADVADGGVTSNVNATGDVATDDAAVTDPAPAAEGTGTETRTETSRVDNGDGTTTITYDDGSTETVPTEGGTL